MPGLYWYFASGTSEPEPVLIAPEKDGEGVFRGFDRRKQTWLRDDEYLQGPQNPPSLVSSKVTFGEQLVAHLKKHGFTRKVYENQQGQPVFYAREFAPSAIPAFAQVFESDTSYSLDNQVALEISEDGENIQYVVLDGLEVDIDYFASFNPNESPDEVKGILTLFGLPAAGNCK